MFIKVHTFSNLPEPLLYRVPTTWDKDPCVGSVVKVPMRNTQVSGLVVELLQKQPKVPFKIRTAFALQTFPEDPYYYSFIEKLAHYYQIEPVHFFKRIQSFFKLPPHTLACDQEADEQAHQDCLLTEEQLRVVEAVKPHITTPAFAPTVLHGVTGSGKTEVYKKLIMHTFRKGKTTILLLPEVTLAVQFEHLLKAQLPTDITIVGFHSATSAKQKKALWANLLSATPQLIIGVHLPVLLPIQNLGLIIIDEEHETGYQEKKHPKINSKEAAILRAHLYNIPIVLGSATPSVATLHNVAQKQWKLFQLKKRFAGAFPELKFVSLLDKKQRKFFWLTTPLLSQIKEQLRKKEQTILFLNRRGVSFFVQCKSCAHIFCCNSCSVSLTFHADNSLRCHYCNHQEQLPDRCPKCHDREFLKKGIGTQYVVSLLQKIFPEARIARADLDATVNRKNWQKTVEDFKAQKLDILVGTQTITKGYHFPHVTLVGILWADINLHFPQYNAGESTLQQLIQVAGRAGRHHPNSTVIIQTMGDHPIFKHMNELDYLNFYRQEVAQRKEVGYPPAVRFAQIELKHDNEALLEKEAHKLAFKLMEDKHLQVLGPTEPPVAKIKKVFSRSIFIKASHFGALAKAYQSISHKEYKSSLFFNPNPL